MKKIIQLFLIITILQIIPVFAQNQPAINNHNRQNWENRQKEIDDMLDSRLHLTQEQKDYIQINRPKHIEQMKEIINKMQILHDTIRNTYQSGIPRFQADIKTAPMKTELGILKQNADKLKEESKKNFENILTDEQKVEFEKIKNEYSQKK